MSLLKEYSSKQMYWADDYENCRDDMNALSLKMQGSSNGGSPHHRPDLTEE